MRGRARLTVEELARQEHPRMPGYLRRLFRGIDPRGLKMLDIGGGSGLAGFYASSMGACEVVCLEPEATGATPGSRAAFDAKARDVPYLNVRIDRGRLQEFSLGGSERLFDLALM